MLNRTPKLSLLSPVIIRRILSVLFIEIIVGSTELGTPENFSSPLNKTFELTPVVKVPIALNPRLQWLGKLDFYGIFDARKTFFTVSNRWKGKVLISRGI